MDIRSKKLQDSVICKPCKPNFIYEIILMHNFDLKKKQ